MSKMGQELEKRLDENKYELLRVCKLASMRFQRRDNLTRNEEDALTLIDEVLDKIEGEK